MMSTETLVPPTADLATLRQRAAHTIRGLAMDAVQKANSGHPGMPMGMADAAVVLWSKFLKHNPQNPHWADRDRFILSAGHGSMLLYSLLHLTGYDLPMTELKNFRQWDSRTPGHPENWITEGVETTTGPLGQGFANAVGMALAERHLAERFNRPGFEIVNHTTYVIASDGDLMEGISHEAGSLAGHLKLGKLVVLYDDNGITIDGKTDLAFSEDIPQRFASYGWHVDTVDGHDMAALETALAAACADGRPSLISCKTHIGYGSPNKQDTSASHGSPLGEEEIRLTKENLDWPETPFYVPDDVATFMGDALTQGAQTENAWQELFENYRLVHRDLATQFEREQAHQLPENWADALPKFEIGKSMATRSASGTVLSAIKPEVPDLVGGSADLSGSNKTKAGQDTIVSATHYGGHYIYYGVREHAMGAMMNGMSLHGGIRPYGGTFLIFSDYVRPAIRLSALMNRQIIYVFTHDSIGLGEDGPTHQPIEHLMSLRAMPNLAVIRPADANETAQAWQAALADWDGPSALALTRQNLPVLDVPNGAVAKGAYILADAENPAVILIGTGSEVHIAREAQTQLATQNIAARVVSMPCWELFEKQSDAYKESVFPTGIPRVAIEAGVTFGWERYIGENGAVIGLDHFGASAPYEVLYEQFGLTAEAVVAAAQAWV